MAKIRMSVDDGCASDVKVAELAKKYNVETIFYWPVKWQRLAQEKGYEPLTIDEAMEISREFEIGSHTVTHPHLTKISKVEAHYQIWVSKAKLEKLFAKPITKFCPPRGYTNDELTKYTMWHYESQRLTKAKGLVHIHPNSGANGNRPWRECVNDGTTEIWGHSWEFDKFNLWGELEEFLRENARS